MFSIPPSSPLAPPTSHVDRGDLRNLGGRRHRSRPGHPASEAKVASGRRPPSEGGGEEQTERRDDGKDNGCGRRGGTAWGRERGGEGWRGGSACSRAQRTSLSETEKEIRRGEGWMQCVWGRLRNPSDAPPHVRRVNRWGDYLLEGLLSGLLLSGAAYQQ